MLTSAPRLTMLKIAQILCLGYSWNSPSSPVLQEPAHELCVHVPGERHEVMQPAHHFPGLLPTPQIRVGREIG